MFQRHRTETTENKRVVAGATSTTARQSSLSLYLHPYDLHFLCYHCYLCFLSSHQIWRRPSLWLILVVLTMWDVDCLPKWGGNWCVFWRTTMLFNFRNCWIKIWPISMGATQSPWYVMSLSGSRMIYEEFMEEFMCRCLALEHRDSHGCSLSLQGLDIMEIVLS